MNAEEVTAKWKDVSLWIKRFCVLF